MKTIKNIIIVSIFTIITLTILTITANAATVKVTGDVLNIRKKPSTSSDVIAMVLKGVECELLEEEEEWYKIKYKSYTGYISKQYSELLDNDDETSSNEETNESSNNDEEIQDEDVQGTENSEETSPEENEDEIVDENQEQIQEEIPQVVYKKLNKTSDVKILPLIYSSVIGKLKKNTEVILIAQTTFWSYIQADEFNGWVRSDVLVQSNTTTSNKENEKENENEVSEGYISESYVNMRKGAGTSYNIIKVLTLNTKVTILGEENGWYKVEVGADTGYVSKDYVSDTKTATSRGLETSRTHNTNTQSNQTSSEKESNKQSSNTSSNKEQTVINSNKAETNITSNKTNSNNAESNKNANTTTQNKAEGNKQELNKVETNKAESDKTETSSKEDNSKTENNSTKGEEVVEYAKKFLGCKYVYGGDGSNGTFDCSGFTMYVYKNFGIKLPHGATSQSKVSSGKKITSQSDLKAGDIVFLTDYETGVGIGHCGIYIGDGNFIHASTTGYKVIISSLNTTYKGRFYSAMRLF